MFSGLYRSEGGRLRQTSDMSPIEVFLPANLFIYGLNFEEVNTQTERVTSFVSTFAEMKPIMTFEVAQIFSLKNVAHNRLGVNSFARCIHTVFKTVCKTRTRKKTSNPILKIKGEKSLDWNFD